MGTGEIIYSDLAFRRRLMTLRSLDDLIGNLFTTLRDSGRLSSTWFFFTADNGFHSGQFTMPDDKRLPYEFDIRVPLIVKPPKSDITTYSMGNVISDIVLNIDLAPTLLDIAGASIPRDMDGVSYLWMMCNQSDFEENGPQGHIRNAHELSNSRVDFLVEYHGEFGHGSDGMYSPIVPPLFKTPPYFKLPTGIHASKMQDCENNTYSCVRTIDDDKDINTIYCHFYSTDVQWSQDDFYMREFFDLNKDAFQINNTIDTLSHELLQHYQSRLTLLRAWNGSNLKIN